MACRLCEKRGKPWQGSDPTCAFRDGQAFSHDNWNCATMNALRVLAGEEDASPSRVGLLYRRDDLNDASIGVIAIPEGDTQQGYLVMTWYKSRGRTGRAYVLCDDSEAEVLQLPTAEEIIAKASK